MQTVDDSNAGLHQDGFIGGFYIRHMGPYPKGQCGHGHAHYMDHVTNILKGPVRVEWSNPKTGASGEVEILVPCKLLIKAEAHHTFFALEDGAEWECWFSEAECEKANGRTDLPWHLENPDV